jgi:hypothetical protein
MFVEQLNKYARHLKINKGYMGKNVKKTYFSTGTLDPTDT